MKFTYPTFVIPAQAGISLSTSYDLDVEIPACAGMTVKLCVDASFRWHDNSGLMP